MHSYVYCVAMYACYMSISISVKDNIVSSLKIHYFILADMKRSTHVYVAVLFSLLLLSLMFTSNLHYYLQQTTSNVKDRSSLWLSHIGYKDVVKLQNSSLKNITNFVSVNVSSQRSSQEVTMMVKQVGGTASKHYRYALSSSYWEQQTNAAINMFCMQRWANSIGLTVVEPFVSQSELKFPVEILHNNTLDKTLRLSDYIDIDYWNAQTSEWRGVPPLETWENFVRHSTKHIVVVIMSHFGVGGTYINDEIKNHPNCYKWLSIFFSQHSVLFNSLQFQVVRNVCFSFFEHVMSVETFNAGLQIENEKDVTVWFTEWRGVENGRISFTKLGGNKYGRTQGGEYKLLSMIHSSSRLLNDSQRYVRQVLGAEFNEYDAVVIRVKPINGYTVEMNVKHYNDCASLLEQYIKSQKHMLSLKQHKAFLAIDMGKFGDMVRADTFDYDSKGKYTGHGTYLFTRFLNIVSGSKTVREYDEDFVKVTNGVMDSGYVGALEKTIAVHAKHVLIVGGHSTFQKVIMQDFAKRHHGNSAMTLCYETERRAERPPY